MPLIATLTLNPAMDLSVSTARVTDTQKLRCSAPRHDPGGGGINGSQDLGEFLHGVRAK